MKVVWLIKDIGNYHAARLSVAGNLSGHEVVALEICSESSYVEFRMSKREKLSFQIVSLNLSRETVSTNRSRTKKQLADALKELEPDLILIPGWGEYWARFAFKWALKARVRIVLAGALSGTSNAGPFYAAAAKTLMLRMYGSIFVGGSRHCQLLAKLGVPDEKVFVGYNMVDNAYFFDRAKRISDNRSAHRSRLGLPERFFIVVCRLSEEKNLSNLLVAYEHYLRESRGDPWPLVVVGGGALEPALREQAEGAGLGKMVKFLGFKNYEQLPSYLALASALVLPSWRETWGLVVNEAMASGVPVLVSQNSGCVEDLVVEGKTGFTFAPSDVDEMAEKMVEISADGFDLEAMRNACKTHIHNYGADRFIAGFSGAVNHAWRSGPKSLSLTEKTFLRFFGS